MPRSCFLPPDSLDPASNASHHHTPAHADVETSKWSDSRMGNGKDQSEDTQAEEGFLPEGNRHAAIETANHHVN